MKVLLAWEGLSLADAANVLRQCRRNGCEGALRQFGDVLSGGGGFECHVDTCSRIARDWLMP